MKYCPQIKRLGEMCYMFGLLWSVCQFIAAQSIQNISNDSWWISSFLLVGSFFTLCSTIATVRICEILHMEKHEKDEENSSSLDVTQKYPILYSQSILWVAVILGLLGLGVRIVRLIYHW